MAIITGQGTALQIGKETAWGTSAAPTVAINMTSEGFKFVPETKEEDTLVGGTTTRELDIMRKSVSWDMAVLAKPTNVGLLMAMAFGAEATPEAVGSAYKHKFTMLPPSISNSLPSFTAVIDRHVATKAYTGCKVGSFSFSCAAGDYVRMTFSGIGKDEGTGTKDGDLTVPSIKAFRFAGGSCTIDGDAFGAVTSVNFSLDNALDGGEQTLGSGYYNTEPEPQKRSVTVSLDAEYNTAVEDVHNDNFKTGAKCAIVLNFESPDEAVTGTNYSLKITLPGVVITDCSPTVTGSDKLKVTIAGTACEGVSDGNIVEAVTAELVDAQSTKYLG